MPLQRLGHPLYMVHWVWGGSTLEAKQQNMRDALKFYDAPEYYTSPSLVTFDLDFLPVSAQACAGVRVVPTVQNLHA